MYSSSYAVLGFAIFGGICFAFLVVALLAWLCYKVYNGYGNRVFGSNQYRKAVMEWAVLQKRFLRKYSSGDRPNLSLKVKLPFPSCRTVRVTADDDGKLCFGDLDCYEFCLFVRRMKELQARLNVLRL